MLFYLKVIKMRDYSPMQRFVARNLERATCARCGAELSEGELKAVFRLNLAEWLCFGCRGYSRGKRKIDIDGPEVNKR